MGNADVTVHQLLSSPRTSNSCPVFLNVFRDTDFGTGVWGTTYPTDAYIIKEKNSRHIFGLVQFESKECAAEWFEKNGKYWEVVASIADLLDERTE